MFTCSGTMPNGECLDANSCNKSQWHRLQMHARKGLVPESVARCGRGFRSERILTIAQPQLDDQPEVVRKAIAHKAQLNQFEPHKGLEEFKSVRVTRR